MTVDDDTVGQRIARTRKLRHLTQRGLAERTHLSLGMIRQVEQGTRQPSPAALGAIARELSVPVADLQGQPYLAELQQDHLDGLINPIRESLDVYDLGADPDVQPRSIDALVEQGEKLCALVRATDLRTAASELPALIIELTTVAHETSDRRAWQALATGYRTAYDVTSKLGFYDLASVSLDRLSWAAERASDPILAAVGKYLRSLAYLRAGQYRTGRRLAEVGRQTAAQGDPSRERDAVTGQLHLGASVLAARDRDGDSAMAHIMEARLLGHATGEATQVHWLTFGPTNVEVHHASILMDQDQFARALNVAKGIRIPADWPASRAAHHRAEIARALLWTGRTEQAFKNLLEARRLAPQQTRYSPTVRETAASLVSAKRATPDTLSSFAVWLGL